MTGDPLAGGLPVYFSFSGVILANIKMGNNTKNSQNDRIYHFIT